MGTLVYKGDAPAVAKIMTATPANVEDTDIFRLLIGSKTVTFTATAATVANVTAGLKAAWDDSGYPECAEVTATDSTTHVTLTGVTAGVDFTITSSTTDGGGADTQTLTMATTTAASGPNCWDTLTNWDTGALPAGADDVILENSDVDIKYGFGQSAITLNSLVREDTFTGHIGLPRTNTDGSTDYVEYRKTFLEISATTVTIRGTGRFQLDTGANQTAITIYDTGSAIETDVPPLLLKGTHAANVVNVVSGSVGIGHFSGDSTTVATLNVSGDAEVTCGPDTTLTTVNVDGGTVWLESNVTTITQSGGTVYVQEAMTVGTLNQDGGTCYYNSSGTLSAGHVRKGATLDFREDPRAVTVSACNLYYGGAIYDTYKRADWSAAGVDVHACNPYSDVILDLGAHITITPSAI